MQSSPPSSTALVSALGELTSEVGRLREAMAVGGTKPNPPSGPRSFRTVESTSEFVSAYEDSEGSGEEAYFDVTSPNV